MRLGLARYLSYLLQTKTILTSFLFARTALGERVLSETANVSDAMTVIDVGDTLLDDRNGDKFCGCMKDVLIETYAAPGGAGAWNLTGYPVGKPHATAGYSELYLEDISS